MLRYVTALLAHRGPSIGGRKLQTCQHVATYRANTLLVNTPIPSLTLWGSLFHEAQNSGVRTISLRNNVEAMLCLTATLYCTIFMIFVPSQGHGRTLQSNSEYLQNCPDTEMP